MSSIKRSEFEMVEAFTVEKENELRALLDCKSEVEIALSCLIRCP